MSEVTPKRPELKWKVMGLISRGERESCCLPCSSVDAPETAVLIAMCSMDIHQYDRCHYLDPHVPSGLETGRTDPYLSSHWGNTSDILKRPLDE